jgi:hypothetical protein
MAENEGLKISVNPGYVLGQLSKAISAATEHPDAAVRRRATERAQRWEQVFQAMLSGAVAFGTRAPVEGVPEWVTLEVLHGGFATGNLLAAGPLQSHELDLLEHLQRTPDETARAALNIYYLSDLGRLDLSAMLESGRYRIRVPEEGALLVVAWLLSHGMAEEAQELIDLIAPFFDRLRFYPAPDPTPLIPGPTVHRHTVAQTVAALQSRRHRLEVERMMEALRVWQPMYDRAVSLFLETVQDDWPCRVFPADWKSRGQALLDDYIRLREVHKLCAKPDRPKENFARLRDYLQTSIDDPEKLTWGDRARIRDILRSYTTRHGFPDSAQFAERRAVQARTAGLPTYTELTPVVIARLQQFPESGGIGNIDPIASPVATAESTRFMVPEGSKLPECLALKARRSWDAPIDQLVEKGVIPSSEVLAQIVPQITAQVRAAGIQDHDLRRLYGAVYSAFRRRRSLLLLNLERQVGFEDLPWIKALDRLRQEDLNAKEQARQVLEQMTTLAVVCFPHVVLPNKLLQELRDLSKSAGLSIPFVDELAADIFMGTFTEKFLRAAQIAATMLPHTLYERYYSLDYGRVLSLNDIREIHGAKTSPGFDALCHELAQAKPGEPRTVSRNGTIIEQAQILTTQNLAPLFAALDLAPALSGSLRAMSEQCFRWICNRQISNTWKGNLRMVKNSAYAWRQMLFFLSLNNFEGVLSFVEWAKGEAARQTSVFARRLNPALSGLEWIAKANSFDPLGAGGESGEAMRFTGWTTKRHWLLDFEQQRASS